MPVQRYRMTVAYRGTAYHGWQEQAPVSTYKGPALEPGEGLPTIQKVLTQAVRSVVRHPLGLSGSSRTDSGVHAKGQIVHFDTDQTQIPIEGLRRAINHALPDDVLVREIEPVPADFDAIRWTTAKRYQYQIWNAIDRPLFFPDLAWHRWQTLNTDAMAAAAERLVGPRDFASFAKPGHGRTTTVRTILECTVHQRGPRLVIGIAGTGFLWQMVRIIVGTLVEVGLGRIAPDQIDAMLAAKDRQAAGPTAPPHGLYLQWIQTARPATLLSESETVAAESEEG